MPRTIWSAWRGSTPRFIATSTVSSNFLLACSRSVARASSNPYSFSRSSALRTLLFLVSLAIGSALHHFEAHRTRGAFDDAGCHFDVVGVEIGPLGLGDLGQSRTGDRMNTRLNTSH